MDKTRLEKCCDRVEKYTLNITMAICAVMLVVAWLHVTRRYVFNSALTWSEEFLRFAIVWYALLSASILHKRNGHLGITIIREALPGAVQKFLKRIVIYLGTLTVALVTVFGFVLVSQTWAQITPALGISVALPYAAIPVSFLLMTLYGIVHVIRDVKGFPPLASENTE
ncbi:MAG TPA: TRAP transporter small permease [Candidatus Methylomirabilis sp.]|nr:TRAP transporter small permease [Candidatus Methylomirabilis sp.]